MVDFADKLSYFQAITGLDDPDLCTEILSAHGWDLELAVSAYTSSNSVSVNNPNDHINNDDHYNVGSSGQSNLGSWEGLDRPELTQRESEPVSDVDAPPGLAWKIITLPFSVISGSLGLISGAIGFGMWVAGGVLSRSIGLLGLGPGRNRDASSSPLVSLSASASEAAQFVAAFERDFGAICPNFVTEGFMDALQRSRQEFKLLFVYLHSPDHPDTPLFCERSLCSGVVAAFINENFVSWGGSIRASEGFKMSNSLKASRFPFCAVVMASTNQRIALLQQIEGPKSPEQLLTMLQRVVEESASVLVPARLDAEERRNNLRLREEQDAAYRAALEADQARERQRKEEQERLEREAAEAERKREEEEEAQVRAAHEAAEKEAALAHRRQEKAMSLGDEPGKGPNVTQVLVRFPTGERKERRFYSTATIQSLYDFVDSLDCLNVENYCLVSNFPRVVYGPEKHSMSLKDAGLHPQASLFVEVDS
ncbi:plant UBX domain-containing protein 10-like [Macadamia integrifolia]|uniref:plant UBX domain-containing protein 10-like n=1 Tax=Macadamia integrifolia TaxID=60698 RepID=UPI001C528319|nr:plant UBX domain-containing protein 10-like [Macadamia integrifolia]